MFQPPVSVEVVTPQVQAILANAVESLRVADCKLVLASEADCGPSWEDDDANLVDHFLVEALATSRLHIFLLQELIGGAVPTIPDRVFRTIREFESTEPENAPHCDGVAMALILARNSLDEALDLLTQDVDDPLWILVHASYAAVTYAISVLHGFVLSSLPDRVLQAILEGRPIPTKREQLLEAIAEIGPVA